MEWVNLTEIIIISSNVGKKSLRRNGVAILVWELDQKSEM